jgi:hypothetical protein
MQTHFFQFCYFVGTPESQMEQQTLALKMTTVTHTAALFQAGHDRRLKHQLRHLRVCLEAV